MNLTDGLSYIFESLVEIKEPFVLFKHRSTGDVYSLKPLSEVLSQLSWRLCGNRAVVGYGVAPVLSFPYSEGKIQTPYGDFEI